MTQESTDSRTTILAAWIKAADAMEQSSENLQHDDWRAFAEWCDFYGVAMPATGEQVGEFLLELLADGASLAELVRSAASIAALYQKRRCFLDVAPIKAALAIAEAQLAPGRVLH